MIKVNDVIVQGEQKLGEGGFVQLRRLFVQNVYDDGRRSIRYVLDVVERPAGTDAVAILPYERHGAEVRVALRRGLRPCIRLGRSVPTTREGFRTEIHCLEVVAGILERGDIGEVGLRQRAARELYEEIGLVVDAQDIKPLGPAAYLSPGLMAERIYFCSVETCLTGLDTASGDGTPLEEGSVAEIYSLAEALELCSRGAIQDVKTELMLRRLS